MCKNNRRGSKDNVRGRWVTVKKGENNTKYSGGFSKVGKAIIGGLFIYTLASYGYGEIIDAASNISSAKDKIVKVEEVLSEDTNTTYDNPRPTICNL